MDHKQKVAIVLKFIGKKLTSQARWAQEIAILDSILEEGYNDAVFWENLKFNYDFSSLAHLKKNGYYQVKKLYLEYLKDYQEGKIQEFKIKYNL